jgi:DNA invertase Pin-like site-specific DNA recombinase
VAVPATACRPTGSFSGAPAEERGQRERRAELEAQRRAPAAACRRRGWQLVEVVEDAGRSAKDLKRPGSEQA